MKILFIACYSPMINNSASIETLMYLNSLVEEGNTVHLVTVDFPEESIYYDREIFKLLNREVHLHPIKGGKLFERIMPKKSVVSISNTVSKKVQLLRKLKNKLIFPDMYLYWSIVASKYCIKLMEKENFDVIFSMHEPPSSHLCALRVKKKFRDKIWVSYWSDPWLKDPSRENSGLLRRIIERKMEKSVVENANKFIFVTEHNRKDYVDTYNLPIEKTFVLSRGYDKRTYANISNYEIPEKIDKNKINMVYAGEIFSKLRDVVPFIKALKTIEKAEDKFNILFFGNIDNPEIKKELSSLSCVQVEGRIPYNDALSYMLNSDILLLWGNKDSKQIPAKIYDYYGTDKKILVILGDSNDPIIPVVKNNDKCIVLNNEREEIVEALNYISTIDKSELKSAPIEAYEWSNIGKRLNDILSGR